MSEVDIGSKSFLYYLMISVFSQPYERYAMPLLPFLCIGAGYFLCSIVKFLENSRRLSGVILTVLFFAAGAPSIEKSLYLDKLAVSADTRTLAKQWMEENLPTGSKIALDHTAFSPRLLQAQEQLDRKFSDISLADPHADTKKKKIALMLEAQKAGTSYEVYYLDTQNIQKSSFLLWSPLLSANLKAFKDQGILYFVRHREFEKDDFFDRNLKNQSELLKIFSPYKNSGKVFTKDRWANTALPFMSRELFSRERTGPVIEIYRLKLKS